MPRGQLINVLFPRMVCLKVCSKAASITQLADNLGQRFSVRDTSNSDLLRWKTTVWDLKSIKTWRSIRWGGALDVQENKIPSLWLPWAPSTAQTKANLQAEISGSHALNMITELFTRSSSFNLSITWPSLICSSYLCCNGSKNKHHGSIWLNIKACLRVTNSRCLKFVFESQSKL